ncbi:hypothetical protein [Paludisphaera rhizosphaerae]|uniref:hypothetical protein n=1 Tax=Paludisphaera rhizosphaerae TaxID=2711216 RepID=UPI0013EB975C|nr:hypothetical protein [Paludisphaera rhizosphaerae]
MDPKAPKLQHPVRAVVIVAVFVALVVLVGTWTVDVPGGRPSPLVALIMGLGYGLFLGAVSVGWVLALDLPVMRWWWPVSSLPLACVGGTAFGLANGADVFSGWFPIALRATYFVLMLWLLAGGLLALAGWWRYLRRRGIVVKC